MGRMILTCVMLALLAGALQGCARCGGWEKLYLPTGTRVCDEASPEKPISMVPRLGF